VGRRRGEQESVHQLDSVRQRYVAQLVRRPPPLYRSHLSQEREVTRKKYVQELGNKTHEQILEEEALYIELKKLEQKERQFRREREELLRTLLGDQSGLPDIQVDDDATLVGASYSQDNSASSNNNNNNSSNNKKRKRGSTLLDDASTASTPSNVIQLNPPAPRKAPTARSLAYGEAPFGH
jgi:DNA methyltransferase 1-associated protein 1